ncbi:MAG: hypothetical protein ACQEXV_24065 [Bacillota bacterium]
METTIQMKKWQRDGITHIDVSETNKEGNTVCSGCKQPIDFTRSYSCSRKLNDSTIYHYTTHKYCRPQ